MNQIILPAIRLEGEIEVPGDKSITHRAFILGSVCKGEVEIKNFSPAKDCLSTLNCLRALGLKIETRNSEALIQGEGLFGLNRPNEVLEAGNSGTTARLLCGLLAGQNFDSTITGDDSLKKRPMDRILQPLGLMGAKIHGRSQNRLLPVVIKGSSLRGIEYELPVPSAQVKSALLLAGLLAEGTTRLRGALNSRDHTERMLQHLRAKFEAGPERLSLEGKREFAGSKILVPGDFSSALFFSVAALLTSSSNLTIRNVGLNPTRTGAIAVLKRMQGEIVCTEEQLLNNEPSGTVITENSPLKSTEILPEEIPGLIDEIPILAVAATQAEGVTLIRGAKELRVKESDRIRALAQELNKMGARVKELTDGLEISGPTKLKGAAINSGGDHRIAMALAVAGLVASGKTTIENSQWADISFPNFFSILEQVVIRG